MSISEDVLELVEEAEGFKLQGNAKFKSGEYEVRGGCYYIYIYICIYIYIYIYIYIIFSLSI